MKMLEIFSGCGGLAKGMEIAGFKHVGFIEWNHLACESLRANFNPSLVHEEDIRNFDFTSVGEVDAIAGGPPCQPFSLGGLAKAYNDERDMFPQAARAISELAPRGFIFENVKGLLRKSFADYFEYILLRLTYPRFKPRGRIDWRNHLSKLREVSFGKYGDLKYKVQYKLVNAADYGVPQIRERVFIVGLRSDIESDWLWPAPTTRKNDWVSVEQALSGVPDPRSPSNTYSDHVFIDGARTYPGHTGSDIHLPSKTIKAGAHGVPGGENMIRFKNGSIRYYTVFEAKRIQTFPADYKIVGSWGEALRQIGNAVPVSLAQIMGKRLHDILLAGKPITSGNYPVYSADEKGNLLLLTSPSRYSEDKEETAP